MFRFCFFSLFLLFFPFSAQAYTGSSFWVYFDLSVPGCASVKAFSDGTVLEYPYYYFVPSMALDKVLVCDPAVGRYQSYLLQDFSSLGLVNPVSPVGYSLGTGGFTQAQLDAAVAAAVAAVPVPVVPVPASSVLAGVNSVMTFSDGVKIAMAVVSASMIGIGFGLMRRAAL